MNNPELTIITPTFNRAKYLKRLYKSLVEQKNQNFEWLVIDDGSTDKTPFIFKNEYLKSKTPFIIKYFYKKNGGKASAINMAIEHINGKYVTIVDSDDFLLSDATEEIIKYWNKYKEDSDIGGITFQKGYSEKEALDQSIVGEKISDIPNELRRGYHGDHFETVRSELMKQFSFPKYKNENFVGEAAMWFLITRKHKVVYIDKVLYICQYLNGGLSKSGRRLRIANPNGGRWHAKIFLDKRFGLKIRFKNAMLYSIYSHFIGDNYSRSISSLKNGEKWFVTICWLPSLIIFGYWSTKYE